MWASSSLFGNGLCREKCGTAKDFTNVRWHAVKSLQLFHSLISWKDTEWLARTLRSRTPGEALSIGNLYFKKLNELQSVLAIRSVFQLKAFQTGQVVLAARFMAVICTTAYFVWTTFCDMILTSFFSPAEELRFPFPSLGLFL